MNNTTHFNLKKPEYTDFADIQDINDNMDIIDEQLAAPTGDVRDATVSFSDSDLDSNINSFSDFLNKIVSGMKLAKFIRDFKAGMAYVLHKGSLINNGTTSVTGTYALDAAYGKTLKDYYDSLNSSLTNLPKLSTTTILSQASQLTRVALLQLPLGTYIVQCNNATDFATVAAYGTLLHYSSLTNYHTFIFVNHVTGDIWTLCCNSNSAGDWVLANSYYVDVTVTIAVAGNAAQLNSNSGGLVTYNNFASCFVVDSNSIVARVHTYSNLLYVKLYTDTGSNAPAGTYKIRCILYKHVI